MHDIVKPSLSRRAYFWYSAGVWSILVAVALVAAPDARSQRATARKRSTARAATPAAHPHPASPAAHPSVAPAPAPIPVHTGPPPIAGKGMWIYQMSKIAGGNPARIARAAKQSHLTHIYVRVGSGFSGLKTLDEAAALIPHAHAHGIKVIGWYFPYFNDVTTDVQRSLTAMRRGFDGFAADIETATGSSLSAATVWDYSKRLRASAPGAYLIAVPPRPTKKTIASFPYDAMMPHYDAVAPMVYWGRFDPEVTAKSSVDFFRKWGKPISPIGQAYDMGDEGGPQGPPPPHEMWAFMRTAMEHGAIGVSFWSWQHATAPAWRAIRLFPWQPRVSLPVARPTPGGDAGARRRAPHG